MVKKSSISGSELLAFAFKDVTPLPGRKIKPEQEAKPFIADPISKRVSKIKLQSDPVQKLNNQPELYHGVAPGLDRRSAQRMKRGQVQIGARLDLHGYCQEEAYHALNNFIATQARARRRCVLVITGKGFRTSNGGEGQIGVLRKMVPLWLNEQPNRSRIISFNYATPRDGGTGALYVLLKKGLEGDKT
jgi:DNA-nicking Smr family endonuclease